MDMKAVKEENAEEDDDDVPGIDTNDYPWRTFWSKQSFFLPWGVNHSLSLSAVVRISLTEHCALLSEQNQVIFVVFCLADLVENFDEASKNEANWFSFSFFFAPLVNRFQFLILIFFNLSQPHKGHLPLWGNGC